MHENVRVKSDNVRVKSDNDLISVSLYKPQLAKNHMQSLASSPLLLNAGAENIPLCLLMAPDLLCHKKDRFGGLFACMGNERQHGAWQDSVYVR